MNEIVVMNWDKSLCTHLVLVLPYYIKMSLENHGQNRHSSTTCALECTSIHILTPS